MTEEYPKHTEFDLDEYLRRLSEAPDIDNCPKVPVPQIDKNQNYLFISYSHRDYKAVYSDLAQLYKSGVRFWYDKGLTVGRDWEMEVEEHIHDPKCCGIVFYISTNMFLSDSILKEIEFTQTRKNGVLIRQKNYFCVNLHNGNISKILHDAQNIREANGDNLLSTKVTNLLTSTFSDDDTYIVYGSKFHLEEMIEQIQRQFNVIGSDIKTPEPSPTYTAETTKEAIRTYFGGRISLIKLCRYLHTAYKADKKSRAWYMIPITWVVGMIVVLGVTTSLSSLTEFPMTKYLIVNYNEPFVFLTTFVFGTLLLPYEILKLFWLFYLTPVYSKCERKPNIKGIHHIVFLYSSIFIAAVIPLVCIVILVVLTAVFAVLRPIVNSMQFYY